MYDVHLIRPVNAGPVLTLEDLERERWEDFAEQVIVAPIENQFATEQIVQLTGDAEQTLSELEQYVQNRHHQHRQEDHSH